MRWPRGVGLPSGLLILIPVGFAVFVWASPLAFVPVPWPDDSAFYFAAKELFKWPPAWVMLPQAPFEPSYAIFNFNTMPLYPVLIGIGRWFGIDGSHLLKFWPLGFWALGGALLGLSLKKARLPLGLAILMSALYALNPILRWSSTLVRPESLVALCGLALVLGLTLGFPRRFRARGLWDPLAALLAVAAYAHFNAIHLLIPVMIVLLIRPGRLLAVALRTLLYLSPWFTTVFWHSKIFSEQMALQWKRLAVPNDWLSTPTKALESLFPAMGSPEPWSETLRLTGPLLWALIASALVMGLAVPAGVILRRRLFRSGGKTVVATGLKVHHTLNLAPASGWILSSVWLWHTKPEVWFLHYLHAALTCFLGLWILKSWQRLRSPKLEGKGRARATLWVLTLVASSFVGIFGWVSWQQARSLSQGSSWRWETYIQLIDCIDSRLTQYRSQLGNPAVFRVWDPTYPDVTIELSRRHPDWVLSRTNDFWDRAELARSHGREVEAVVVPESLSPIERTLSAPASEHPEIRSVWMNWKAYFLHPLLDDPHWKPERYLCQRGKWQAFVFTKRWGPPFGGVTQ